MLDAPVACGDAVMAKCDVCGNDYDKRLDSGRERGRAVLPMGVLTYIRLEDADTASRTKYRFILTSPRIDSRPLYSIRIASAASPSVALRASCHRGRSFRR